MHSGSRQKPPDPYPIILREEERFAREVALAVLVARDMPMWRTVIPGMFLLDFLERGKMIRRVRSYYLPPRTAAVKAAQSGKGRSLLCRQTPAESLKAIDGTIAPLLQFNGEASQILFQLVETLTRHYAALAAQNGPTFADLVRNTYGQPEAFTVIEQQISRLESDWSAAVKSRTGVVPIPEHHMQELIARRQRRTEQIFSV